MRRASVPVLLRSPAVRVPRAGGGCAGRRQASSGRWCAGFIVLLAFAAAGVRGDDSVDELFSVDLVVPAEFEPASLRPHVRVVQRALPVVAESTFRLGQAEATAAERAAAFASRARARAGLLQFDAALADLEQAIALASEAAEHRRLRAWVLGGLGRHDEAVAELEAAFRLAPESTATARMLGLLRFAQGRFAAAAAALDFHLEDQPAEPPLPVLLALARIRAGIGGPAELAAAAERARYFDPWPQAIATFMAGRLARPDLLALARGDGGSEPAPVRACQAWFYLGQRALLEGDPVGAREDFRRAVYTGGTSAIEYRFALAELR